MCYRWRFDVNADSTFEWVSNFWTSNDISFFPRIDEEGIVEHGGSRHLDKAKSDEEALCIMKSLNLIVNGCRFISSEKMDYKWEFFNLSKKYSDNSIGYLKINEGFLLGSNIPPSDNHVFSISPDIENIVPDKRKEEVEKQEYFVKIINSPFLDGCSDDKLKATNELTRMVSFSSENKEFRELAIMCGFVDFTTIENKVLSWGLLYKITEYINAIGVNITGNKKDLVIPKSKDEKFKNASNNYSVLGFMSRHGNIQYNSKRNTNYSTDIRQYAEIVFKGAKELYHLMDNK